MVVPNSNPPYPSLLKPHAPLLATRLLNVAIQTFSQLFVYTGSSNRGHMIEVVLKGMSMADSLSMEDKQTCAYNILSILWCVVDVGVVDDDSYLDCCEIRFVFGISSLADCYRNNLILCYGKC